MNFQQLQKIKQLNLIIRNYAFKSDLKIKWVRPEKIPCFKPEKSGDCEKMPVIDPKALVGEYHKSQEIQSAGEDIRALFEIGNNPHRFQKYHHRMELIKRVQRHPLDYGSMEVKLARMTANIHYYQEHMERHPRDVKVKVELKETIDKRKKFLKYLRRWDYRRFEWVLEKLDLIYKPPPNEFHWITRKESLQKLTDKYCEQIKEDRLEEYRLKLEAQRIPFLEDAIQKLERIRKDQIEYELKEIVKEEDILAYKELLAKLYAKQAVNEKDVSREEHQ